MRFKHSAVRMNSTQRYVTKQHSIDTIKPDGVALRCSKHSQLIIQTQRDCV